MVLCACVISDLLQDWSAVDVGRATEFVQDCLVRSPSVYASARHSTDLVPPRRQTYEGGYGQRPGQEAQGKTHLDASSSHPRFTSSPSPPSLCQAAQPTAPSSRCTSSPPPLRQFLDPRHPPPNPSSPLGPPAKPPPGACTAKSPPPLPSPAAEAAFKAGPARRETRATRSGSERLSASV